MPKCPHCHAEYVTQAALDSHIRNNHYPRCPLCGKSFSSSSEMNSHIRNFHGKDPYDYNKQKPWRDPIEPNVTKYRCPRCGKVYYSRAELDRHYNVHRVKKI